ncbi:IPO7 [Cordylochernes scorpioides]|uniref:IPO7 n=1 Tax=Cordylochernes scorpioides TaxID=51811 RepID=A0ABY6LHG5_9ARAC|nr:IPO7 [Cordylochernes scorpioides]
MKSNGERKNKKCPGAGIEPTPFCLPSRVAEWTRHLPVLSHRSVVCFQYQKLIGFPPCLLQTVMMTTVEMPVRQAGAIYLKNMVIASYQADSGKSPPTDYPLHEQDRAMLRESIVDAVVQAPDLIKTQLAIIVFSMVQHEFPHKWPQVVEKISMYLQSSETNLWSGALRCLHKLVKNYEYKKADERKPLNEAMVLFLPMLYEHSVLLLHDQSDKAYELQKLILKIFYSLVQYIFPRELISNEVFSHWMEIFRTIVLKPRASGECVLSPPPRQCGVNSPVFCRPPTRYGSPGNVSPEYQEFANFYLKTFSTGILEAILKTLFNYTQKEYVSPRVLHQCLNYLHNAVSHGISWKYLKPNIEGILEKVVFPLMSYSEQDEELWKNDPHEYIRMKFDIFDANSSWNSEPFYFIVFRSIGEGTLPSQGDIYYTFEDFVSPVSAAQKLVHFVCKMRKNMLNRVMRMVMVVLDTPTCTPRDKDGALHIVGTVAGILLKKKLYKNNMETMLVKYVYPEFQSPHGFLRARACWVLHHFCEILFQNEANLIQAVNLTQQCFLQDRDLPVKLEAAIALQGLVSSQERAESLVEPNIQPIALEMLNIIRETENEDLTSVMQKLICTYSDQLMPIAVQMVTHLVSTSLWRTFHIVAYYSIYISRLYYVIYIWDPFYGINYSFQLSLSLVELGTFKLLLSAF